MKTIVKFEKNRNQKKIMPQKNDRVNFDTLLKRQREAITKKSLKELSKYREALKNQLEYIHTSLKEKEITEGRTKYLQGKRKFTIMLLSSIKNRIKEINMVVHNGVTISLAKRFFEIAAKELPIETFQVLLGIALTTQEIEESKIKEVKDFMQEAKNKAI